VQSPRNRTWIDEYLPLIHLVILGAGPAFLQSRGDGSPARLVTSTPTTTGVIIATYQPGPMN